MSEHDLALLRVRNVEKFFLETSLTLDKTPHQPSELGSTLKVPQSTFEARKLSNPLRLRKSGKIRVSDEDHNVDEQKLGKIRWIANQSKVSSV